MNEILKKIGLEPKEIDVFLKLLRAGSSRASTIAYQLGLPRTTVQNILIRLEAEKLVTKSIEKNAYIFSAVHPKDLESIIKIKKRQAESQYDQMIDELKVIVPEMSKLLKSNRNIPGVKFYQGREGVRSVLFDTLTSKTELKGFVNADAMFDLVKDINDEYVAAREKTSVTKRGINIDTPFARQKCEEGWYSPKSYKDYRFLDPKKYPFEGEVNIYDGKVSYITYVENEFVAVIIENEYIYKMHESMWNFIWDHLPGPKKKKRKRKKSRKKDVT